MTTNGLVVMTPTGSPAVVATGTGSSATVNSDGSVTFSACSTLSLNGVFTANYDNYMISIQATASATSETLGFRMRSGGTDDSSNNYVYQYLSANNTAVSALRGTLTFGYIGGAGLSPGGSTMYIFGPFLAQPTIARFTQVFNQNGAEYLDQVISHSLSTSYSGLTILKPASGTTTTGKITVFGFNQ